MAVKKAKKKTALTAKREDFAQALTFGVVNMHGINMVERGNASAAYAYSHDAEGMSDKTINEAACRLKKDSKVAARLVELGAEFAELYKVSQESVFLELEDARRLAFRAGQSAAAVSAIMGKAKVAGLLVDKQLHGSDPDNPLPNVVQFGFVSPSKD